MPPPAIHWSPGPSRTCRRSKRARANPYSASPSQNSTSAVCASQAAVRAAASVAARTASPCVATQSRNTAPGMRRVQCRTTMIRSGGHSTADSASRASARVCRPSAENRVPSTVVAATAVSAPGVRASVSQRPRSSSRRATKSTASPAHATHASTSAIRDTVSAPVRCRPTDTMPVAITAAPAAGGRCAHQARKGELPDMSPMLRASPVVWPGHARGERENRAGAGQGSGRGASRGGGVRAGVGEWPGAPEARRRAPPARPLSPSAQAGRTTLWMIDSPP